MEAIGNNVVIKPDTKEKTTQSGLIIPDSANQDPPTTGEVISVGSHITDVVKGDKVVYKKGMGYDVESKGESLLIVPYTHLLSKF